VCFHLMYLRMPGKELPAYRNRRPLKRLKQTQPLPTTGCSQPSILLILRCAICLDFHQVCLTVGSRIHSHADVFKPLLFYIENKQLASFKGRHVLHTMSPHLYLLALSIIFTTRAYYSALRQEDLEFLFSDIYSIVRTTGHGADIAADCLHRTIYP
jgi:hypothetical protein